MSALVFVDTNVLLATYDERDLAKQSRAREWVTWCWQQRAGRISTQVLNELYNNAITRFRSTVTVQRLARRCAACASGSRRTWTPTPSTAPGTCRTAIP